VPKTHADRRASVRYTLAFGADVHTQRGVIAAGTHDVSRGGCQLVSGQAIDEGAVVMIDLCLTVDGIQEPDFPRITVRGRVQWTAEGEDEHGPAHRSGVRFLDMTAAQGDWLEQILRQHGQPADDDFEIDVDV
jgi:hypothetical protein